MNGPASHQSSDDPTLHSERRAAMAVLAQANADEIENAMRGVADASCSDLRAPESGLVMVRGRIGGDGAPFNVGEATVTRAAVRLQSGETGFGYVLGRDLRKARFVAICDALFQKDQLKLALERDVLAPIRTRLAAERQASAERTAATRVDFFTLVRGEG